MKPIHIIGFTPLGVILAERLTYLLNDKFECDSHVSLIEQVSPKLIANYWQDVSLFCLMNLLKQGRMLQSNASKKFGINVQSIQMNKQILYSYIQSATKRVQKYYLSLLKHRHIHFKVFNIELDNNEQVKENELNKFKYANENNVESIERLLSNDDFQLRLKKSWQTYFNSSIPSLLTFDDENFETYVTYNYSPYDNFALSPRINAFHAIFQYLLSYPSLKLIGPDIFSFEFAYLLSSLGQNEIYFYRMNPNEKSLLPTTETNTNLIILFQVFSKFIHEPLVEMISKENHRPRLHIIEQFHNFKMNENANGKLTYDRFPESSMPTRQTPEEIKKHKRTYLETFKQETQESFTKLSKSNICFDTNVEIQEESLDYFLPSCTFFVLIDMPTMSDLKTCAKHTISFSEAIRTFNSTPGALILNIYETLRKISSDPTIPEVKNIFLSVDRELCVLQKQTTIKNDQFGVDRIFQSQQHDLKRSVENLHDLYKIIQRPINQMGQCTLYESQLFQNDALDLQSLLLLFNPKQEIPKNELIFLFNNDQDWHNVLVLPDQITFKNNNQL